MPDTPLLASSQPAAGRRALGLSARLAFAALAGGGGLAWIDRGDTALWLIAPALLWLQVLLTLAGVLALAGGSRLPGALIVALSAGLLVPPLTVEMRLLGFFLAAPPPDQSILTTAQYTLAGALAAGALAWILARRRFGRPPCSWTMLDCGGPGAEIDMDAALASLSAETLRRRDRAYIDAPPPLPFAPRGPPRPPPPTLGGPRLKRMPAGLGGAILCLESDDHTLRVHTTQGSGTLAGRLGDAALDLGESAGLRVHRSWWVAREAVSAIERDGRRMRLILLNGMDVPVSRAHQPKVLAGPWPNLRVS